MRPYFEKMTEFGHTLKKGRIKSTEENLNSIKKIEEDVADEVNRVKLAGFPEEKINARGQMTVWQRLEYLVDPGTWCPLHTLYNPMNNAEGTTNVIDGVGKISGKWAVIIGFDNKVMAGAWLPGQSENILRVTDLSKRLNIPLVWLVNCSGANCLNRKNSMPIGGGPEPPFSDMPNWNRWGFQYSPAYTALTLPAAGIRASVPPYFLRTKTVILPWVVSASLAAWRPKENLI